MTYRIDKITLNNFKSFEGEHKFVFPTKPGLYSLTGDNQDNPRLGAEGVGKSALLEAVYWCRYGSTTRGLKAGDIVTWGQKHTVVTLTETIGDKQHVIKRAQNPNSLTLDGKPIDQTELQKHLVIGPEAYTYAIMLPQFGDSFFDLKPTEKLTLFSEILGLEYWLAKSKEASAEATAIQNDIQILTQKLERVRGQRDVIKSDIVDLTTQEAEFVDKQTAMINKLRHSIEEYNKELQQHTVAKKKKVSDVGPFEAKLEKCRVDKQELVRQVGALSREIELINERIELVKDVGAVCQACGQQVDKQHRDKERIKLIAEKKKCRDAIESIFIKRNGVDKDIEALDDKIRSSQRADAQEEQKRQEFIQRTKTIEEHIDYRKKQMELESKRENPYTKTITAKRDEDTKLRASIKTIKTDFDKLGEDYTAVSFWVTGFKRVRLFIIEETLQQLEIEVNNSLSALGLTDWSIQFDVERENKSGGITKGFVVLISSPKHSEPVRFEAWSGGETQRLRLAGTLGLANLIMERAGLISAIEFFDEPSQHMGAQGRLDLAETLYGRAKQEHKAIFYVDHNLLDFGDFERTITVVKDDKGSRIT